jgi:formylglycine-generating enzyme required for sulfatase activity
MVADPPVVPVVVPPISAENKPAAARQPAASEQTVASRVETQTQRRFGMKGITFIGLLGLFLWWLAVSGSWNRDVGRTKNDLVTESSPSKEVVAPTVDSNAAMSESKKAAESVKPEPKETAELPIRLTNSLGMEFRLIQPGMFMMGTPENEIGPFSNETQHRITCTKPFYLGVYEVTQGEWEKLMGSQPSYFQNQNLSVQVIIPEKQERFPVENISWIEANVFCETLTSKERRAGRISDDLVYRLPTEDEWWTVAGRDVPSIEENQAWFSANSNNRSHEVGLLTPNALGIFDLFGNVEEMTTTLILDEKSGEKTCSVLGGSWFSQPSGFDDLNERRSNYLDSTRNFQGFRVVLGSALGIE